MASAGGGGVSPAGNASATCDHCGKTEGPFQRCAKCKSASYCGRECQAAHWKTHKKSCSIPAHGGTSSEQSTGGVASKRSDGKPFTAIYDNNFLHDRSEEETFKILVDVLRMRQEDKYALEHENMPGTIMNHEPTSEKAFRQFLRKAKATSGFLPPWWTDEKAEDCVRFGLQHPHFNLKYPQEKSDIQDHWKDDKMPMKLRMLGEKVYKSPPGGTPGAAMLEIMMSIEDGTNSHSRLMLDWTPARRVRQS